MIYYTSIMIMTLLALGVLSILIVENNRISEQKKHLFIATNILIALAAIAECTGVHISGHENIPRGVLAAVKAVDYTLTPMAGGSLIISIQKPNTRNQILPWLFAGNALLQIISAFHGWMVTIDNQNHYTHGPLYPVYIVFYLLIIIILTAQMLSYGKSFRKQNRHSLYATIFLVLIGIAIQEVLTQNCRVSYLALTFGATFLFIHYSEFSQLQLDDKITEQQIKLENDILTGTLSRFAYIDTINSYGNCIPEDFAVFLIDINGLKIVNDSLGHKAGDELICGAAQCIERSIGKNGKTFRIGGDEFVVFAIMTQDQAKTALIDLNQQTQAWSGKKVNQLSVSVGCILAKDYEGFSIEDLVKEADQSMYQQKKAYYQATNRDRRHSKESSNSNL